MQASQSPSKIPIAFATSGTKNVIPELASGITQPNDASFETGFPPVTMTSVSAGGIPPNGEDFNGAFFALSAILRWSNAGGLFKYDSAFATDAAVNGYPKGAVLESADGSTLWLCLNDNVTTDPDDAASTDWAPLASYGITAVAGLTNANVTLTPAQFSKPIITLAGTLTGNVQIIFPANKKQWTLINNCTGAFSVTCKTAAGSGIIVPGSGGIQLVFGDGTNILSQGVLTQTIADALYAAKATVGSFSAQSIVTSGTTFTIANAGAQVAVNSASPTSHNLPAASTFANGKTISFSNIAAGIATFNRAGSDTITGGNLAAATAFPLNNGEMVTLVSDGASKWYVAETNVTIFAAKTVAQTTTSGSTFDFALPPGTTSFGVSLVGCSLTGTDDEIIQLGVGGVPTTTGYDSSSGNIISGSAAVSNRTNGFAVRSAVSGNTVSALVTFTNTSGNVWQSSHAGKNAAGSAISGGGNVTLSGVANMVRVTVSGSNTFNAGLVNLVNVR